MILYAAKSQDPRMYIGASCWNSYMSSYNRAVTVYATNELTMALWLTNESSRSVFQYR